MPCFSSLMYIFTLVCTLPPLLALVAGESHRETDSSGSCSSPASGNSLLQVQTKASKVQDTERATASAQLSQESLDQGHMPHGKDVVGKKKDLSRESKEIEREWNSYSAMKDITAPQPSTCKLPPSAPIGKCLTTKVSPQYTNFFVPTPVEHSSIATKGGSPGSCLYDLVGTCEQRFDFVTGCNFFGKPGNEQYAPADLLLPGPAAGEIPLTENETNALLEPFRPCDSRPKYYLVSVPPIASKSKPLAVLSGGSPSMTQHVYFVANEMCIGCPGGDSYHLGNQTEEDMKVVVDVGANIGYFSIAVCKRFPKARIIAFEPHPANYRFLKANLLAAGCADRVETYNKGLSRDGRTMKLFWSDSIRTSAYRLGANYVPMQTITPSGLQQILNSDSVVTFMKIDCEGCEYEIVPLMQKKWIKKMFCEVHGATVQTGVEQHTMDAVEKSCREWNPEHSVVALTQNEALVH